jgi:transglutaminase-like putative cysteine protease
MYIDGRRIARKDWMGALERLVQQSVRDRLAGVPPLAQTTVRYVREPAGREKWQSARTTYLTGEGDCEDLAIYLAADARIAGVPAIVVIKPVRPGLRHALVAAKFPGNRVLLLDPSRVRGMTGAG